MAVEDRFEITGRGVVVTGQVERGTVRAGDTLELVGLAPTRQVQAAAIEMYRKVLEEAGPGDNVGILLSGVPRDEIQRGQVPALPGTIKAGEKFGAELYVNTVEEGGARQPLANGMIVEVELHTTTVRGVVTFDEGTKFIMPGDHTSAYIEIIQPLALEEGLHFTIVHGGRRLAFGFVYKLPDSARTGSRARPAPSSASGSSSGTARKVGDAVLAAEHAPDETEGMSASECYNRGERAWKDKDYETAAQWYEKAALRGYAPAQSDLGYCYSNGYGMAKDPEKAVYWFEKAAVQGDVRAQYELGQCYRVGYGVKKDKKQAKAWLKKAAKGGDQDAKAALKELRWPWS